MKIGEETLKEIGRFVDILYVEYDKFLQSQILSFLNKYFKNIKTVSSGKEALTLIERQKFDILILDIKLPDISGVELAKIIKEKYSDILIFAITDSEDLETIKNLIDIGIDKLLIKPFKLKEFAKKLFQLSLQVYKAKKKEILEKEKIIEIKKRQLILEKLPFGIVLIFGNKIEYMNYFFKELLDLKEVYNFQNLSDLFNVLKIPDFKDLSDEEILNILRDKSYFTLKIKDKQYVMEIESLEEEDNFLLIFMNLKILEEKIEELKKEFYYSELTKLPNIYQFKEKLSEIKRMEKKVYFFLFRIHKYNFLKRFIGKKYSYMILVNIIRKIIEEFKKHYIWENIYFFEYAFNRFLIVVPENMLEKVARVFKKYETYETKINKGKAGEPLGIPIPLKINLNKKLILLEKEKPNEEILEIIDNEFDSLEDLE